MKLRCLLKLTILSTIALPQDVYPFFSDPNQQLEFSLDNPIYVSKLTCEM